MKAKSWNNQLILVGKIKIQLYMVLEKDIKIAQMIW